MAWKYLGEQLAGGDADQDADEHPDRQVALEDAHRRLARAPGRCFACTVDMSTPHATVAPIRSISALSRARSCFRSSSGSARNASIRSRSVRYAVTERRVDLGVGADRVRWVVDAPVRAQHRTQIGRAGLAGGTRADGDDDVRRLGQIVPRLAVTALGRDAFALQQRQRARVHLACRLAARTHGAPAGRRKVIEGRLSQDRATRVARAQEHDLHGVADLRLRGLAASGMQALVQPVPTPQQFSVK